MPDEMSDAAFVSLLPADDLLSLLRRIRTRVECRKRGFFARQLMRSSSLVCPLFILLAAAGRGLLNVVLGGITQLSA